MSDSLPSRRPLACGALGRYERDRVAAIARAMPPEMAVAHEQRDAILMLDRPAIRWSAPRRRGFAWSERVDPIAGGEVASWREPAAAGACCSLVVGSRRPFVHSSVSGMAPIYYLKGRRAVYFCSRIDPLLAAAEGLLSVDWDAWAATLVLANPQGDRTPFAEVRRLPPFATVECRRDSARVSEPRWPWAEVEPHDRVEEAADEAVASMRTVFARFPDGRVGCPLSGGWDSRMAIGLLAERRRGDILAVSTSNDDGTDREERFAAGVAEYLGIPHETILGRQDTWWDDMRWAALQTDYQLVSNPWLVPLIPRLREGSSFTVDGLALDLLGEPGGRYISRAAVDAGGGPELPPELWKALIARRAEFPYRTRFTRALHASAYRQLQAVSKPWEGHPSRVVLTQYRNRTVRGISLTADTVLGASLPIAIPFTDDAIVRVLFSVSPPAKFGSRLRRALLTALDPALGALPSTNDDLPIESRAAPMRRRSPEAAREFSRLLMDCPLTPHLSRPAVRLLTREARGRRPRVHVGALPPALFALWHERYRSRLREVDPAELLA